MKKKKKNKASSKIKLYVGDCIAVMKTKIDDESIDLIVTSPPYNCGIKYDNYNDSLPKEKYYRWCKNWLKECYRVLKNNRRIAINVLLNKGSSREGREQPVVEFCNLLKKVGFSLNNITLWMDEHRVKHTAWGSWKSASAPYIFNPYEVIIMASKGKWERKDRGVSDITRDEFMEWVTGRWRFNPEHRRLNPAPFPEELPKRCIKLLSYVGDTVLDPFVGSGTTCVAAKKLNRNCIGIDISKKYINIAKKRIKEQKYGRLKCRKIFKV